MNKTVSTLLIGLLSGIFGGAATAFIIIRSNSHDQNALIRDFYLTENAVHVSPHSLRKKMDDRQNDYILVDLRSQEEYEREHIAGAVSIPAYADPNTSAYGDVDRIIAVLHV